VVMGKGAKPYRISPVSVFLILLAVPKMASAYVDPGTGTMIWQMAAAAVIGSLFYVKRAVVWMKTHLATSSPLASGYAFATVFAALASAITVFAFQDHTLPRFNDLFLIGIVLTAYLFRWEPSIYLLGISLLVSAWVLPPGDSFRVQGFQEWYRLISFAVLAVFLVYVVSRTKARRPEEEATAAPAYPMHGAAAGAD
jgi:hypothetical protein